MKKIHNFRELKIWQKARNLVKEVYDATKNYPKSETYGLQGQSRRSVVSIAANIAEGSGKGTDKDFNHYLNISRGSLFELQTLIILARDLDYFNEETLNHLINLCEELERMMLSFQNHLI
jgi:four helix bundle protein